MSTCSASSMGVMLLRLTLAWILSPDRSSSATARARNSDMRPHSTVFCALLRRRSRLLQIRRAAVLALPTCARTHHSITGREASDLLPSPLLNSRRGKTTVQSR